MLFQSCNCDSRGSVNQNCDSSGQCSCKPNVVGKKCNQCASKYYGLSARGCQVSHQQKDICTKTKNQLLKQFFQWFLVGPQNVRNFSCPVRIRWIKSSNLASFIYIAGYLNVRKMSEMVVFRTFVGALQVSNQLNNICPKTKCQPIFNSF